MVTVRRPTPTKTSSTTTRRTLKTKKDVVDDEEDDDDDEEDGDSYKDAEHQKDIVAFYSNASCHDDIEVDD